MWSCASRRISSRLRPDQKDVDAAVINMADPFTEEILREQAEAARKAQQTNIIEESQAPQEEFVPQAMAATAKMITPPRRPAAEPLSPSRTNAQTAVTTPPPMPPVTKLPTPPSLGGLRPPSAVPPPNSVPSSTRSATSSLPMPTRPTTVLPTRPQAPVTMQFDTPTQLASAPPVPPVPRNTGSIPAPPPPKHTTSVPVARRTGPLPSFSPASASQVPVPQAPAPKPPVPLTPPPVEPTPAPAASNAPEAGSDELQRLAALAMAQLGDSTETGTVAPRSEPEAPAPEPAAAVVPEAPVEEIAPPVAAAPEPAPEPQPEPIAEPAPLPPVEAPVVPQAVAAEPAPAEPESAGSGAMAFNLNTCTAEDLVKNIPGCSADLAESIVAYPHQDRLVQEAGGAARSARHHQGGLHQPDR